MKVGESECEHLAALANARKALLAERNSAGHWEGELSTSALSTATAIVALGSVDEEVHRETIETATAWLVAHRNADGGWGDTGKSFSNISTTLLCWSALSRFGGQDAGPAVSRAAAWIRGYAGSLHPGLIAETVKARYGKDRTFSVPILMLCAICGTLGPNGWRRVLRLPFELAAFPRTWYAAMRLPVVSYALPALIAIGYAGFRKGRIGSLRSTSREGGFAVPHPVWPRVSRLLAEIQPTSGGFLEAAPLTSFVTMALVAAGEKDHPVVEKGVGFLLDTVRADGSWPIDTNLATWATTLSVKALFAGEARGTSRVQERSAQDNRDTQEGGADDSTLFDGQGEVLSWLLRQQYRAIHPFTNSPPGGWAWTDLSGGVPDADDTPGAMLAIRCLDFTGREEEVVSAVEAATVWLLDLQNRDGGIPTFCRGWGALPFDRSSQDLTAHALRAWRIWRKDLAPDIRARVDAATQRAIRHLERNQRSDGSWVPLWFGNQHRFVDEENPTYGTAMVLRALEEFVGDGDPMVGRMVRDGVSWLLTHQNEDGGWGALRGRTPSSIEETSLALSSLAVHPGAAAAVKRGLEWLFAKTKGGTVFEAAPIGFYFARLWYFERSYPVIWATEAFARTASVARDRSGDSGGLSLEISGGSGAGECGH